MDDKVTIEKESFDEISFVKLKMLLKDYYMLVIVLVLISLSLMLVLIPFAKEIATLRTDISKGKKDLEALSQKETKLKSLEDFKLNSQVSLLESALPSEKPALYIIDILNASSAEFNLQLGDFEFSPGSLASASADVVNKTRSVEGIDSIEVDVEVSGEFDSLLAYIDYLENALPLMKAKSIGFSTASRDKNVEVRLSLDVYFLAPPKTIGKTSDPLKDITSNQLSAFEKISQYTRVVLDVPAITTYTSRDNPFDY